MAIVVSGHARHVEVLGPAPPGHGGDGGDKGNEPREQHHRDGQAIHAHQVLDVEGLDPSEVLYQLHSGGVSVDHGPPADGSYQCQAKSAQASDPPLVIVAMIRRRLVERGLGQAGQGTNRGEEEDEPQPEQREEGGPAKDVLLTDHRGGSHHLMRKLSRTTTSAAGQRSVQVGLNAAGLHAAQATPGRDGGARQQIDGAVDQVRVDGAIQVGKKGA